VHLRQKKTAQFLNDLAMIAANDADDIAVRKALAERHLGAVDAAAAEKWANECLYIDVYDPSVHLLLAEAQALGKKYTSAIEEFETALALKPKKPNDLKVKLAQAQLAAGQRDAARATVDGVLKADPEHPEAKALREKIEHPTSG
jgi:Tfp pilus assembly protein PilF